MGRITESEAEEFDLMITSSLLTFCQHLRSTWGTGRDCLVLIWLEIAGD